MPRASLAYLQYVDPEQVWDLVSDASKETRSDLKDPALWLHVYHAMLKSGVSPTYAERWRRGFSRLANGAVPTGHL